MTASRLEESAALHLRAIHAPEPEREYRFAAMLCGGTGAGVRSRLQAAGLSDWRLDFAWPKHRIALEVEGGVWSRGRHVRGGGYREDVRKYNALAANGWTLFRVIGEPAVDAAVYEWLERRFREGRA